MTYTVCRTGPLVKRTGVLCWVLASRTAAAAAWKWHFVRLYSSVFDSILVRLYSWVLEYSIIGRFFSFIASGVYTIAKQVYKCGSL